MCTPKNTPKSVGKSYTKAHRSGEILRRASLLTSCVHKPANSCYTSIPNISYDVGSDKIVRSLCDDCRGKGLEFQKEPQGGRHEDVRYLTIKEACELLSTSRFTLHRLRKEGALDTYDMGGRPVFLKSDVIAVAKKRKAPR